MYSSWEQEGLRAICLGANEKPRNVDICTKIVQMGMGEAHVLGNDLDGNGRT